MAGFLFTLGYVVVSRIGVGMRLDYVGCEISLSIGNRAVLWSTILVHRVPAAVDSGGAIGVSRFCIAQANRRPDTSRKRAPEKTMSAPPTNNAPAGFESGVAFCRKIGFVVENFN